MTEFTKVEYDTLNNKQKENYNFQKVSSFLADYGFTTIKLNDDWQGADFIAQHFDGETFLKVQLKGGLTLDKKYMGKNIFLSFSYKDNWYLFNHDEFIGFLLLTAIINFQHLHLG